MGMSTLNDDSARAEVINRLRRAEGQLRGVQRMLEAGESCDKISQQFAAVRKALDSTYLRLTMCFMQQELSERIDDTSKRDELGLMLKDMESLLARLT